MPSVTSYDICANGFLGMEHRHVKLVGYLIAIYVKQIQISVISVLMAMEQMIHQFTKNVVLLIVIDAILMLIIFVMTVRMDL